MLETGLCATCCIIGAGPSWQRSTTWSASSKKSTDSTKVLLRCPSKNYLELNLKAALTTVNSNRASVMLLFLHRRSSRWTTLTKIRHPIRLLHQLPPECLTRLSHNLIQANQFRCSSQYKQYLKCLRCRSQDKQYLKCLRCLRCQASSNKSHKFRHMTALTVSRLFKKKSGVISKAKSRVKSRGSSHWRRSKSKNLWTS